MAWIFELATEHGPERDAADECARHFQGCTWTLSDRTTCVSREQVIRDSDANWWCTIYPTGVSSSGAYSPTEVHRMSELGRLLYERLRTAPSFRFARVGVEVEVYRTASELLGPEDIALAGTV